MFVCVCVCVCVVVVVVVIIVLLSYFILWYLGNVYFFNGCNSFSSKLIVKNVCMKVTVMSMSYCSLSYNVKCILLINTNSMS